MFHEKTAPTLHCLKAPFTWVFSVHRHEMVQRTVSKIIMVK